MSGGDSTFAYLQSRVAVRSRLLLKAQRIQALIDCPREDEPAILAEAGLQDFAETLLEDPSQLEQTLIHVLVEDATTLVHAVAGVPREMLVYWARRFELGNLKAILRGKMTGESPALIRKQLVDIGVFATLPVDTLMRTDDTAELLRLVETTPYADIARQARRVYEEQQALFGLDAAVDRRYFAGLSQRVKAVGEGGGEPLRALIGTVIDRLNLSWLLRYRFTYRLAPAEAYYLLIPAGFRLDSADLLRLAQTHDVPEFLAQLPAMLKPLLAGCKDIADIDNALRAEIWRSAHNSLYTTAFNLARAFAYLILRERDLNRIAAVIKGKRLNIDPQLIRAATLLPAEPATAGTTPGGQIDAAA